MAILFNQLDIVYNQKFNSTINVDNYLDKLFKADTLYKLRTIKNDFIKLYNIKLNISKYDKNYIIISEYSKYNIFIDSLIKFYKSNYLHISENDLFLAEVVPTLLFVFIKDEEIKTISEKIYSIMNELGYGDYYKFHLFSLLIYSIYNYDYNTFMIQLNKYVKT